MTVVTQASPSLALIKYWGKLPSGVNLAATSSLAVTLGALHSQTCITDTVDGAPVPEDVVFVDGEAQPLDRFAPVINGVRSHADFPRPVRAESTNTFPTAAGLASSSSGLAALAVGLDAFFRTRLPLESLSSLARLGSGSACRAVFGGFTTWPAGSETAEPFLPADHWEELRVLIVVLEGAKKPVSSRDGMERTRLTSPYYSSWVHTSANLFDEGCAALTRRDIERLGSAMRRSYLAMFSTMFTSDPPIIYWLPESLAVIRLCERLRAQGVPVWETMDAGPQVKLVTLASSADSVTAAVRDSVPASRVIRSPVGGGPTVEVHTTDDGQPHG